MPQCFQCLRGTCVIHPTGPVQDDPERDDSNEDTESDDGEDRYSRSVPRAGRRYKPDSAVTDQQSTGRKRAAKLYPLDEEADCEWKGKKAQGGGDKPIDGCLPWEWPDGKCKQLNRHHGPDKNTLNNEPGNVHRIGPRCHNRWHSKNDPDYNPNKPLKD